MARAPWLERHDEFEGVGAHELNRRYDHVDGGDWDAALRRELGSPLLTGKTPALLRAQLFSATIVAPIRFDGADISHYQADAGTIDWPTLRTVSWWVATKATQSLKAVDPTFHAHRAQMGAQGFPNRLFYHWLSSTTDPAAQAAHYLNTIGTLHPGEGVMLDAEEGGITAAKVLAWLRAVEQVTHRPASVYTGAYVAGGTIWQSTEIRNSLYGPRPMHLAAYTTEQKALALPGVKAYPWDAWQYSSNGPVPGVVGRCDMNRVDNREVYDLACGVVAAPPLPQPEDDMPAFISNKTSGKYGAAPSPQGGCTIWERVHNAKLALSFESWVGYGMPYGVACDDATLDGIPDYVAGGADEARLAKLETVAIQLNDGLGRVGQEIHEVKTNLVKAGGG